MTAVNAETIAVEFLTSHVTLSQPMKKLFKLFQPLFLMLGLSVSTLVNAALEIEITGGGAQQIPIAIVPFAQAGVATQEKMSDIIAADLRRSGLFRVLETAGVASRPSELVQVKYPEWAVLQAQAITVGNITALPGNRLKVSFGLGMCLNNHL